MITFDVQTESVEFAPDGSSGWFIIPQLVLRSRLVPGDDLCSRVLVSTLDIQGETVHSAYYHERLLHPAANADVAAYNHPLVYDTIESLTWTGKLSIQLYLAHAVLCRYQRDTKVL